MAQPSSLEAYFDQVDPELEIYMQLMNLEGEVLFSKNDTHTVAAASTIKIPILIEYFVGVEMGRIKSKQKYLLQEADKVGGSGDLQYLNAQSPLSYHQLATEMIRISDNTATNILLDKIGVDNINRFLSYHNLNKTKVRRKMMDFDAVLAGRENTTCAADMNQLMLMLVKEGVFKEKYHKSAIEILLACEDFTTFPAQLPSTPIAHKTGTLDYIRADVGIIYGKTEPLILSAFVGNFESYEQAEKVLAEIAKLAHDLYN